MAGKQCPSCGLWNPPESLDCYCGRPLVEDATNLQRMYRSREQSRREQYCREQYRREKHREKHRPREQSRPASWLVGLGLFVGGSAVTILRPDTAGSPVNGLAGSAMLVGLIWMIYRAATSMRGLR
jgi:hypothetical protein